MNINYYLNLYLHKKANIERLLKFWWKKNISMQRKELASLGNIGDGKTVTNALEELCECGFIRLYDNYETSKYGKFYQIIDPFILFARNFRSSSKFDSWFSFGDTPLYYNWTGHAFEIVCLNHINEIKKL